MNISDLLPFLRRGAEPEQPDTPATLPAITAWVNGGGEDPRRLSEAIERLLDARTQWTVYQRDQNVHLQRLVAEGADEKKRRPVRDAIARAGEELALIEVGEPALRQRYAKAEAQAKQQARQAAAKDLMTKHRSLYGRQVVALRALVAILKEQTALKHEWDKLIGDRREFQTLPIFEYAGFMHEEHVEPWIERHNQVFFLDQQPKPVLPAAASGKFVDPWDRSRPDYASPTMDSLRKIMPRPGVSMQHAVHSGVGTPIPREMLAAKRMPDDLSPLEPGQARVIVLQANWSPSESAPACYAGQKIRMPESAAHAAVDRGQVEILEVYTEPPPATVPPIAPDQSNAEAPT